MRESKLPISPGEGLHGLSLLLEPKAPEGRVARTESGHLAVLHVDTVVEIPSDDEADVTAEPPVSLQE